MARFPIYRLKDGDDLVIDLQADLLSDLKTRIVASCCGDWRSSPRRLYPSFTMPAAIT